MKLTTQRKNLRRALFSSAALTSIFGGIILTASLAKATPDGFAIQSRYAIGNLCLQQTNSNLTLEACDSTVNSQRWQATQHYREWYVLKNSESEKCLWFTDERLAFQDCERNTRDDKKNLWKGIGANIFAGDTQNVKITVWAEEGQCLTHSRRPENGEAIAMEDCDHFGGSRRNRQDWRRINFN